MDFIEHKEHKSCIIVGAGMCGVALGAQLVSQKILTYDELAIIDKHPDYGGVWLANNYPGAACDIVSHCYSMSFHLNPKWSRTYGSRDEIQQYYAGIARYYGLQRSTIFNTAVISARWDENSLLWKVITKNTSTGLLTTFTANVVVSAVGQFSRPKYPKIPGASDFRGAVWHTAEWNHKHDLTGKRVAIIGTGPSTAQIVPVIQPIVKQLTLYQRSPTYVLPRNDGPIPRFLITLFTLFPTILWLYHQYLYFKKEFTKERWFSGTKEQAQARALAVAHLESQISDPILRAKLMPNHEFGCKRPLVLDDYYPTLCKPNVELITDKPVRITQHSIISEPVKVLPRSKLEEEPAGAYDLDNAAPDAVPKETEIDVLIWGTGFEMRDTGGNFDAYGLGGRKLQDMWGENPKAYYGVATNQFPNFFIMFGPNTGAPWANLCTMFEIQATYIAQMVRHIMQHNSKVSGTNYAVMVDKDVQNSFNTWIQANMGRISVVSPNCSNYYTNSKGDITFNWPFHGYYYRWCLRKPNFNDYVTFRRRVESRDDKS